MSDLHKLLPHAVKGLEIHIQIENLLTFEID